MSPRPTPEDLEATVQVALALHAWLEATYPEVEDGCIILNALCYELGHVMAIDAVLEGRSPAEIDQEITWVAERVRQFLMETKKEITQ